MDARHDEHYLRDVTSLGDSRQMVVHTPIYAQNRIKLVNVGTPITSSLFEKLVRHKLLPAIDQCITVENEVTADILVGEAKRLIEGQPFLFHLAEAVTGADDLLEPLRQIVLEPPLALKLTVMQDQRPELFRHSLEMAIIALYLARGCAPQIWPGCAYWPPLRFSTILAKCISIRQSWILRTKSPMRNGSTSTRIP